MKFKKRIEKLLGEILVEKNIISSEQLKQTLDVQLQEGGHIGEIVVRLGFATEEDIAQCISFQYGFPYLPLENYEIPEETTKLIPRYVANHYCVLPIDKMKNTLIIVMANPFNLEAIEDLEDLTSSEIQIFISTASDIRKAIERCYKNEQSK